MKDPIFIVGNSRSGTTLLSRILKRHPDIHILNETHFLTEFHCLIDQSFPLSDQNICKIVNTMLTIQRKDYYRKSEYEEYVEDAETIIKKFYKSDIQNFSTLNRIFFEYEANRLGKKWAGDQTPRHVFDISTLLSFYPDAKIIHMVRNPCAVLLSQKQKWKASLRWGQPWFEVVRTFINHHPITTVLMWVKSVNAGVLAQQRVSKQSMTLIQFENLCMNPNKVLNELCQFLDIEYYEDMVNVGVELSANIEDEGKKGISKIVSERWANELSKTEIYLAEKIAHDLMISLGYGLNEPRPNFIQLLFYIILFPFQILISFLMNLGRMGNPISFISKRLFPKTP